MPDINYIKVVRKFARDFFIQWKAEQDRQKLKEKQVNDLAKFIEKDNY